MNKQHEQDLLNTLDILKGMYGDCWKDIRINLVKNYGFRRIRFCGDIINHVLLNKKTGVVVKNPYISEHCWDDHFSYEELIDDDLIVPTIIFNNSTRNYDDPIYIQMWVKRTGYKQTDINEFVRKAERKEYDFLTCDTHRWNFGIYEGRLVMHDW